MSKIIAFGGSLRAASYNQKLAEAAAAGARDAGAEVTVIALRDFPMPLYDQDIEDSGGMPGPAAEFKKLLAEADGFLIATPEYNGGYTAALKNAIDWASRATAEDEPPLSVFKGKSAAILAGSPGKMGGKRSLAQFRTLLEGIRVEVIPEEVSVPGVDGKFGEDGKISDAELVTRLRELGAALARKLSGASS